MIYNWGGGFMMLYVGIMFRPDISHIDEYVHMDHLDTSPVEHHQKAVASDCGMGIVHIQMRANVDHLMLVEILIFRRSQKSWRMIS